MPQVHRSFYADGEHTGAYWTFIAEELPQIVGRFFRVSDAREDTFVAGLSMGGYGAMRLALHRPERFAAAASLSGALDVAELAVNDPYGVFRNVTGTGGRVLAGTDDDLFAVLDRVDAATVPPLYVRCGTEDGLVGQSSRFDGGRRRTRDPPSRAPSTPARTSGATGTAPSRTCSTGYRCTAASSDARLRPCHRRQGCWHAPSTRRSRRSGR